MSSSPYSTIIPSDFDIENTFSSTNILNYFPASPGNNSPDSSHNFTKYLLDTLVFSPLHDDPYMEDMQAYDVPSPPQFIITLPAILPSSPVLSQSLTFDFQDFFISEEISSEDTEISVSLSSSVESSSPIRSILLDYPFGEFIFAELDNSLWIMPRPLREEPVPEEPDDDLWK